MLNPSGGGGWEWCWWVFNCCFLNVVAPPLSKPPPGPPKNSFAVLGNDYGELRLLARAVLLDVVWSVDDKDGGCVFTTETGKDEGEGAWRWVQGLRRGGGAKTGWLCLQGSGSDPEIVANLSGDEVDPRLIIPGGRSTRRGRSSYGNMSRNYATAAADSDDEW
jgi:hypothetical protein